MVVFLRVASVLYYALCMFLLSSVDSFFSKQLRSGGRQFSRNTVAVSGVLRSKSVWKWETLRSNAAALLRSIRVPHRKDEAWRHTNIKRLLPVSIDSYAIVGCNDEDLELLRSKIGPYIDPQCLKSCVVCINGRFSPQLSNLGCVPNGIDIRFVAGDRLPTAQTAHVLFGDVPDLAEQPRDSYGSDYISALNTARCPGAVCVDVAEGVRAAVPVQVLCCTVRASSPAPTTATAVAVADHMSGSDPSEELPISPVEEGAAPVTAVGSYPALAVALGRRAALELKQTHVSLDVGQDTAVQVQHPLTDLAVGTTRIVIGEEAAMNHTYWLLARGSHAEVVATNLTGANSSYQLAVVQDGPDVSRVNVHVGIHGMHSNCTVHGVTLAGEKQSLDLHTSIWHNNTFGTTRQQQRNVIGTGGEAVFKGRIRIPGQAQDTDADQLCRSIMLGPRARLQAMPVLEITADRVACSHGATVADLDVNSQFYLASRGIDAALARKLLLRAFVLDPLEGFLLSGLDKERVMAKIEALSADTAGTGTGNGVPASGAQKFISI